MSVIERQSFKYSLVGYFGFLLGSFSAFFIFPYDLEYYGKLRYVLSTAEVILPFVVFGLSFSNVKFFLKMKNDNKEQNILSLSLLFVFFIFVSFFLILFLINFILPNIKKWDIFQEFWEYRLIIIPLVFILAISQIYNKYLSNYKRIVVPNIFDNVFPKLANFISFVGFVFMGFSENIAWVLFLLIFVITILGYHFYTDKVKKIKLDFSTVYIKKNGFWKEYFTYGFHSFLGNIGTYLSLRIATVMIPSYLGYTENGVYGIIIAITSLIMVPQMGINTISTPVISEYLENKKLKKLQNLYQNTSLSLIFVGLIFFVCLAVGYPYLTQLMKNGDELFTYQSVLWIISIALLFDLITGFNGQIISMSKYYRYNTLITLFYSIINVFLLLYFLKCTQLGLIGVALATSISQIMYDIIKTIFNYKKFKIHPFSFKMLFSIIACFCIIFIVRIIPDTSFSWLNIMYKPLISIVFILIFNYYTKIIPIKNYINKKFLKNITKIK